MLEKYQEWIQKNVEGTGKGKCLEVAQKMLAEFPELILVRGHYIDGKYRLPHWWLKTADDEIVDPTAAQFFTKGLLDYEEWDESKPEPTGKCPNCGGYCYDNNYCCCKKCEEDYHNYIMGKDKL
jgi:hypothetical protein